MADITCARCRRFVRDMECQGESGIYSVNRSFMLCEPCFDAEDKQIDRAGTNDIPELVEEYRANLRAGPLNKPKWP